MTGALVRARAPLRLGLAGGGTDLPVYADQFGGVVLNATIERYAYAFLAPRDDGIIAFSARDLRASEQHPATATLPGSQLLLHKGVYERMVRQFNQGQPIAATVTTTVDAPMGSGLGSSSALVVALIAAYGAFLDLALGPYDIARLAFEIERLDLGLAGGMQDQYAAAFGGVNFMEFLAGSGGRVIVNPLRVADAVLNELESALIACFSGQSRLSDTIIRQQAQGAGEARPQVLDALHHLKDDAVEMKGALLTGDIGRMAALLNRSWAAKKATSAAISTEGIERLHALALAHGALAGKVSGAGGGGFLMFIVRPECRLDVIEALSAAGAAAGPVKLTARGSESWTVSTEGAGHRLVMNRR